MHSQTHSPSKPSNAHKPTQMQQCVWSMGNFCIETHLNITRSIWNFQDVLYLLCLKIPLGCVIVTAIITIHIQHKIRELLPVSLSSRLSLMSLIPQFSLVHSHVYIYMYMYVCDTTTLALHCTIYCDCTMWSNACIYIWCHSSGNVPITLAICPMISSTYCTHFYAGLYCKSWNSCSMRFCQKMPFQKH